MKPISGAMPEAYPPPRNNVLLLTCMDVRLIDEIGAFMRGDNLTNRYDHLILAGASLGVLQETYSSWRETFFQHLDIALELHQPRDVYIIEHRNCGAYRKFLGLDFGDTPEERERERIAHAEKAYALADAIAEHMARREPVLGQPTGLNVHCFLMDLRGRIEVLERPAPALAGEASGDLEEGQASMSRAIGPRRTLADLILLVLAGGIASAAHRYFWEPPPDTNAWISLSAFLVLLSTATLGSFLGRPGWRTPCRGFAAYGWCHLACVMYGGFLLNSALDAERIVKGSQIGAVLGLLAATLAALILQPVIEVEKG